MRGSKKRNKKKRKKGSPSATFPVQKQGESKEVQTELSSGVENGSSEAERVLLSTPSASASFSLFKGSVFVD